MAKKRIVESASPTDEWGIYDPAKAGMQALFSRLGRPILRASAASTRRDRHGAARPERSAEGVGLAIEEAKQRAAMKSAAAAAAAPPPPPAPDVATALDTSAKKKAGRTVIVPVKAARPAEKRTTLRAAIQQASKPEPEPVVVAKPVALPPPAPKPRAKKAAKPHETARAANVVVAAAPTIPPPSPRRPRGPVPLAAWAHAASDTPRSEPRHADVRGLWRGIFSIPSDVALVEYGRGCRIHRLVIETSPERFPEPF